MKITHKITGAVLHETAAETIREVLLDAVKTEIHTMGLYVHQIVTRTKGQVRFESINIKTGERKTRVNNTRSTPQGFESDLNENSKPTHRCAVLILEKK